MAVFGFLLTLIALVLLVIFAPLAINPNQFKAEISAFLKNKSGRDIAIEGDVQLAYIPRIAIKTGKIVVGGKPNFSEKTFATIENSEINVEPLPLLNGKVIVNSVVLEGLMLNLFKDQQGRNNWDDLLATHSQSPASATMPQQSQNTGNNNQPAIAGLALGVISVKKGHVTWDDRQVGKTFDFKNIEFSSDKIVTGKPVNIALATDISGNQFSFPGNVKVSVQARFDESLNKFTLAESKLAWSGRHVPSGQPLTVAMNAKEVAVDRLQQTLKTSGLQLQSGDVKLAADMNGEQIFDNPSLQGQVAVEPFNLGNALPQWGMKWPVTADAKALSSFSMKSQFRFAPEKMEFINLDATLDDSHGKGSFVINNAESLAIHFDLAVDTLDLDRYLPPREKADITTPGFALAAGMVNLPLDWLKKLDASGKLALGRLKINQMTMQNTQLTVSAKGGDINMGQAAQPFYQGGYVSELRVKAHSEKPQLTLRENMTNVQLQSYLQETQGKAKISGLLTAASTWQSVGESTQTLRNNLSGQVSFFLKDGFVSGFNLDKMIEQAKNAIKSGNKAAEKNLPNQTAFKAIKGTVTISEGQLINNDLIINAASFKSQGEGHAVLATGQLDYKLTTRLLKAEATPDSPEQFHGTPIVIHVGGTLGKPDFTFDVSTLLTEKNKAKLESLIDHNKDKIDKLMNKMDKKTGDKVKQLLKQIF